MTTYVADSIDTSRTLRIDGKGIASALHDEVYLSIPCSQSDCGEHVLAIGRDALLATLRDELGLIDPLAGSFELSEDDLALLGDWGQLGKVDAGVRVV